MEMSQIRYFIAVSETLNFTRAAKQCCISQPALTKGIKKLESIIGGELFYRTKSSVELSDLGSSLLPNFKDIYLNAEQTEEKAKRILCQDDSCVKVGFQSSISFEVVFNLFEVFRSNRPSFDIEYCDSEISALNDKLIHHDIDILIGSRVSSAKEFSLDCVYDDTFVTVFNRQHDFVRRDALVLKDFENEKILFRKHCESSSKLYECLQVRGYNMRALCYSPRDDWIANFVNDEGGIAIVPRSLALANSLLFLPIIDYPLHQSIYAEKYNGFQRNKYVEELLCSILKPVYSSESAA
ncbi:LysR family transcriptional regulator [Teredinibacter haidensis]|uniref:LysR family transcriptional regulator n=1 Tax=Teredinibacter haidensis TaxID=2731755 RepID=UPI000948F419|nr:LysR family transcriptional regulator [Teredinibacter haidensis]